MGMHQRGQTWALVLAGGDGVASPLPFSLRRSEGALLQDALRRAQAVVDRDRICTLTAATQVSDWHPPAWQRSASHRILQYAQRGTGAAVLLGLLRLVARDPEARVLLLPCDHAVRDEAVLSRAMRAALAHAQAHADAIVLLGFEPDAPLTSLGYIVPAQAAGGTPVAVSEFVEKPTPIRACELVRRGALWNGFIIAASAAALLRLYQRRHAHARATLASALTADAERSGLRRLTAAAYVALPRIDFSLDVLVGQECRLSVLAVPACGWVDIGQRRLMEHRIDNGRRQPATVPGGVGADGSTADPPSRLT